MFRAIARTPNFQKQWLCVTRANNVMITENYLLELFKRRTYLVLMGIYSLLCNWQCNVLDKVIYSHEMTGADTWYEQCIGTFLLSRLPGSLHIIYFYWYIGWFWFMCIMSCHCHMKQWCLQTQLVCVCAEKYHMKPFKRRTLLNCVDANVMRTVQLTM